ncbi:MAG: hypothetical protein R3D67_22295 [Hyphomicrobiaceae bacterium]
MVNLVFVASLARAWCVLESLGLVAARAFDLYVAADQREAREIMIECHPGAPLLLVVAAFAARAELTFVRIILLVAADAGHGEFIAVEIALVAASTLDFGVRTSQWKFRSHFMLEVKGLPIRRRMTCFAASTVPTEMGVVDCVARHAGLAHVLIDFTNVTGAAGNLRVRAVERKRGCRMIKRLGRTPCVIAMALGALGSQTALVRLIALMAGDASVGGSAVLGPGLVARRAIYICMRTREREIR